MSITQAKFIGQLRRIEIHLTALIAMHTRYDLEIDSLELNYVENELANMHRETVTRFENARRSGRPV